MCAFHTDHCLFSDFKLPLSLETQISLTSSLFGHVVLGQACHFLPTYLTQRFPHVFSFLFVLRAYFSNATYTEKNRSRKRTPPSLLRPPPSLWKGRAGKEGGGVRQRGRVIQSRQSYVWHPYRLKERRTGTRQTEQNRKRRKRGGRGNKCKKRKRKRVTVMYKGCISSCPQGTKTLCSWIGAGELPHMASAVRKQAD